MKTYCLTLDLKDDPQLIQKYVKHHRNVWPEILQSIQAAGIQNMKIYRVENRLCMILQTADSFTFENKEKMDAQNKKVQEWEALMWRFQEPLPFARPGEKWILMEKIFET